MLSFLQYQDLLSCALVSHRWRVLANAPSLWKHLCFLQGWQWRESSRHRIPSFPQSHYFDDEGVGEDEDDWPSAEVDSGFVSMSMGARPLEDGFVENTGEYRFPFSALLPTGIKQCSISTPFHHTSTPLKPDYKLLHQTHILLRNRLLHSSYRLTYLQTQGTPNAHNALIYCLQLHTIPGAPGFPNRQVLFTGSRDRTIRQWNLSKGVVERIFQDVHEGSILSICIQDNYMISGGSDRKVVVWDLESGDVLKIIEDHLDSVLCVRADTTRLVTCSKGVILLFG